MIICCFCCVGRRLIVIWGVWGLIVIGVGYVRIGNVFYDFSGSRIRLGLICLKGGWIRFNGSILFLKFYCYVFLSFFSSYKRAYLTTLG